MLSKVNFGYLSFQHLPTPTSPPSPTTISHTTPPLVLSVSFPGPQRAALIETPLKPKDAIGFKLENNTPCVFFCFLFSPHGAMKFTRREVLKPSDLLGEINCSFQGYEVALEGNTQQAFTLVMLLT